MVLNPVPGKPVQTQANVASRAAVDEAFPFTSMARVEEESYVGGLVDAKA
jgi:hypothetical protein